MSGFPFSAIVGQNDLKRALLLNAVSPSIGGVLVRGEKGTAKSTAVRSFAALLPKIDVVVGCAFNCDPRLPDANCPVGPHDHPEAQLVPVPLEELPVGASTDRVVGSLDFERALNTGTRSFEPGVLARAHRGILYVDEVNLLPDHLADLLLDAAALGFNHVERDGISVTHPARFILIGTMNPEEGELRPQLLDRFGITVEVKGSTDIGERTEVVRRRLAFESRPDAFREEWADRDSQVSDRVTEARNLLSDVSVPDQLLERIAQLCTDLGVDGLRADIVTAKTASALAAWEGRAQVTDEDIDQAALLALPHRRRRSPLDEIAAASSIERTAGERPDDDEPPPSPRGGRTPDHDEPGDGSHEGDPKREEIQGSGETYSPIRLELSGVGRGVPGHRSKARSEVGYPVGDRPADHPPTDISIPASLLAAAPHQLARRVEGGSMIVTPSDLRRSIREGRESNLIVFVVDASASMGARRRMREVKAAVISLLLDAYRRRDVVALITFSGESADVMLPPTRSVDVAAKRLEQLPVGGKTPLATGLLKAHELIEVQATKERLRRPLLVLITDGAVNAGGKDPVAAALGAAEVLARKNVASVIVTTDRTPRTVSICERVAAVLGAPVVRLDEVEADVLTRIVVESGRRVA